LLHRSEIAWDYRRPDKNLLESHIYYYESNNTDKASKYLSCLFCLLIIIAVAVSGKCELRLIRPLIIDFNSKTSQASLSLKK